MALFFSSPALGKKPLTGYGNVANSLKPALDASDIETTDKPQKSDIQLWYGQPFRDRKHCYYYRRRCDTFLTYTMFESTRVPKGWVDFINSREGFLTPSKWCADWFQDNGVKVPIDILHHGIDPEKFAFIKRPLDREYFTFIWQGINPNDRKGGELVRNIFRKLRLKKARLIMKGLPLFSPSLFIDFNGIKEIIGVYTIKQMQELYYEADFSINPTRGEGFGCLMNEHAATGLDVAVTNFSGCLEYLEDVGMHPIKWKYNKSFYDTQVKGDYGHDALPDEDHVAEIMEWANSHRDEVRERGREMSQAVHERWTWQRPINQLREILPKYEYQ